MTLEELEETAFGHGFAFGKYTCQNTLDEKLIALLDSNQDAMRIYMTSYNKGFELGFADTLRYERLRV